jgi:hypothetical protein
MANSWTNEFLDQMRQVGDPLADDVIASLFQSSGVYAVATLMKTLVENDEPTPDQIPAELKDYLAATSAIPQLDPSAALAGQHLFVTFGPEMLIVLLCYSLPACYADEKGVQVLYRSGYLNNRVHRRVFETAQMVFDAMVPGGLDAQGRGVRSAQKVRLMHAAVRWLLLNNPETPWDPNLGKPINQEDLGFTLMTFAYIILDGLHKLGITVIPEEQQGFLETWKMIGRIMGVQEAMMPDDIATAKTLFEMVQKRQDQPSPQGKAMTQALLDLVNRYGIPGHALMRHFLSPELADGFGIENHPLQEALVNCLAGERHLLDPITGLVDRLSLTRKVGMKLIQGLVTAELGGKRTAFVLPTNLNFAWHRSEMPSLWQQLRR